jgi:hypothetical protein
MTKVRRITQLELEGFASQIADAEEAAGGIALSAAEVREREMAAHAALKEKLEGQDIPGWADLYHRLINASVPWKIAAYIAWSTMPRKFRWPQTQEELAVKVLGLNSDRRIAEWRKKYPYIDQMIADFQAEAMLEYVPGAIHALGTVASDTSYRANPDRRLLFEITRLLDTKQKVALESGGGVGKDLLRLLDAVPTDRLIEMLGEEGLELIDELRGDEEDPGPGLPPNTSTDLPLQGASRGEGAESEAKK